MGFKILSNLDPRALFPTDRADGVKEKAPWEWGWNLSYNSFFLDDFINPLVIQGLNKKFVSTLVLGNALFIGGWKSLNKLNKCHIWAADISDAVPLNYTK